MKLRVYSKNIILAEEHDIAMTSAFTLGYKTIRGSYLSTAAPRVIRHLRYSRTYCLLLAPSTPFYKFVTV